MLTIAVAEYQTNQQASDMSATIDLACKPVNGFQPTTFLQRGVSFRSRRRSWPAHASGSAIEEAPWT
jgi:hypothetical protein